MADFKEYSTNVGEGNEQRTVTVNARRSEGDETVQTTGGPINVNKGDYVVTTDNPNVFDVVSKESWNKNPFKSPYEVKANPDVKKDNPKQSNESTSGGTR